MQYLNSEDHTICISGFFLVSHSISLFLKPNIPKKSSLNRVNLSNDAI